MNKQVFFIFILFICSITVYGQSVQSVSSVINIGSQGKILPKTYANNGEKEAENVIPDFSYAGYMGGGVAIPDVPVKKTLSPGKGDQTKRIQDAINEVSKLPLDENGFRGRVLLKKGKYHVNGGLSIVSAGVVLSGEGQGDDGTVLIATRKKKQILVGIGTDKSTVTQLENTKQRVTSDIVPTGSVTLKLQSTKGFQEGDTIFIVKTPNEKWIKAIQMEKYGWKPKDYNMKHERIITTISGNNITVNIPLVDAIDSKYGGASVYKAKINRMTKNSGVENMRMVSEYASETDENHGWEAVKIRMAEHCWARKITAQYFGMTCVTILKDAVFNTVEDCAMLDPKSKVTGGRRYSFNIISGSFNLFQRCYTRSGRHDFVTGARVGGPNVFLDCYAEDARADTGPHQRWATGILFDNVFANSTRVINAKANGTGHGWTGAQIMFWNCEAASRLEAQIPPTAMNWNISTRTNITEGSTLFGRIINAVFTSTNQFPRSLYLQQLEDRLGRSAVENITTAEQRRGSLFNSLKRWSGG